MSAAVYGVIHRLRWIDSSDISIELLGDNPTREWVELGLCLNSEEIWGFAPDSLLTLVGDHVVDPVADTPARSFEIAEHSLGPTFPTEGTSLVAFERATYCWAALYQVRHVEQKDVTLSWRNVDLPGFGEVTLGMPMRGDQHSSLVWPPAPCRPKPAILGRTVPSLVRPLRSSQRHIEGQPSLIYRYGLLKGGQMQWLKIKPGRYSPPADPITARFRQRLAALGKELARQGVLFEVNTDLSSASLFSYVETPPSWSEEGSPMAYVLNGRAEYQIKLEQAQIVFNPERDCAILERMPQPWHLDFPVCIDSDNIYFSEGQVGGRLRSTQWTGWMVATCARRVGLFVRWSGDPKDSIWVSMYDDYPKRAQSWTKLREQDLDAA